VNRRNIKLYIYNNKIITIKNLYNSFINIGIKKVDALCGIVKCYLLKTRILKELKSIYFLCGILKRESQKNLQSYNFCFGENSLHNNLYKNNEKLILFDDSDKGYTFFHYIEESYKINYRYDKIFSGTLINKNGKYIINTILIIV